MYDVVISTKYKKRKRVLKRVARKYGLKYNGWTGDRLTSSGAVSKRKYKKLEILCQEKKLKMRIQNEFSTRSTNYRQVFFEANPPVWRNKYFCAYCGVLISKELITVDHLYPVNCVQTDINMQKKLQKKGWYSINDVRNLVAACECCNKKKSANMGRWIWKGSIGRHNWFWTIRYLVKIIVLLMVLAMFIYHAI